MTLSGITVKNGGHQQKVVGKPFSFIFDAIR